MKYAYNPRTGRYEWNSSTAPNPLDNVGQPGIDSSGNPTIGIGSGVNIDLVNGDLTIGSGGFSIDTGGSN